MSNEVKVIITGQDKSGPAFDSLTRNAKRAEDANRGLADRGISRAESGMDRLKTVAGGASGVLGTLTVAGVGASQMLDKGISVSMAKANAEVALGSDAFGQLSAAADLNANRMGFTTGEFIETAGSAAALATNLGFSQEAAGKLGAAFPDLADKLATLSNGHATTAEAAEQLRSAMAGEYDPLQSLGIAINAAAVETKALALQQSSATPITKEQASAMAVLAIVQEQTANATKVATTEAGKQAAEAQKNQAELKQAYEDLSQTAIPVLSNVTEALANMAQGWGDAVTGGEDFGDRIEGIAKVLAPTTFLVDALTGSTKDQGAAAQSTKVDIDGLAEGAKGAGESQEELAEKTAEATGKIADQAEVVADARQATRDWQESIDDAKEAIKENGKTVDDHTEKGRANNEALDNMAAAARDVADAVVEAGGSESDYRKSLEKSLPHIISTAQAMGYSASEAEDLAAELLGIPKKVRTTIGTNAGAAIGAVRDFKEEFYALSGAYVGVSIGVSGIGALGGYRHGGPRAAAGGGRGGLTLVGENGPELVPLQHGSMVHDAATTRTMRARGVGPGGGGSGGPVVVNLVVDGRVLARAIVDPLRGEIRQGGGDVQGYLGDNRGRLIA